MAAGMAVPRTASLDGVTRIEPDNNGEAAPETGAWFLWDIDRLRITDANATAVTLFGEASLIDLIERPFAGGGALASDLAGLGEAAAGGATTEGVIAHPSGANRLAVVAQGKPLPDGRVGLHVEVVGPAETTWHHEARGAALAEALPVPGAMFGTDGAVLAVNDVAQALLGEDVPPLAMLLGDRRAAERLAGQALAEGLASATFRVASRFGPRLMRVTLARMRDPETGAAAVAATFHDIADRARALAAPGAEPSQPRPVPAAPEAPATNTANDAAEARALLSRVGHELRTPLNAILGFAEIMADERFGPIGNPKYAEYARDIHVGGEHLLGLVDDLLEMARSENGRQSLNFEAIDLSATIRQIADLLRDEARAREIDLVTDAPDDVPPVVADQRTLRQILINLIGNAIKFTEAGGTVRLATSATDEGGVALVIADTGIGMDKDDLAAALEPFGQIERAQAGRKRGIGLGLPLARSLAQANKAAFEIESEPGKGTTVTITFPPTSVLAT